MTPEEAAYVRYRLERSRSALGEADLLLKAGYIPTAVNRIYYACFYSVSALLLTGGENRSKHTGVRSLFDKDWVKPGLIPPALGRLYHRFLDHRQEADYKDMALFDPDEVAQWLREAKEFVASVSAMAEERLGGDT